MLSTESAQMLDSSPASMSGKMCQDASATRITPSVALSRLSPAMRSLLSRVNDRQPENLANTGHGIKKGSATTPSGRSLVLLLDHKEQSRGSLGTLNISDWPSAAAVCSLSQVLVRGSIPEQYFLSPTACAGILRRAENRGKTLPEPLMRALMAVAFPEQMEPVQDTSFQQADPMVLLG